MNLSSDFNLTWQLQLLNQQSLEELRLFVAFLLQKQQSPLVPKNDKPAAPKKLLADLKPIAVPVNHVIIDRAELYEDRI